MKQHRGITASFLALVVVTGAGYLDFYILQNGLPRSTDTANVVVMILTAWNGIAAMVCNYYYGASHDAKRATEIMGAAVPGLDMLRRDSQSRHASLP